MQSVGEEEIKLMSTEHKIEIDRTSSTKKNHAGAASGNNEKIWKTVRRLPAFLAVGWSPFKN